MKIRNLLIGSTTLLTLVTLSFSASSQAFGTYSSQTAATSKQEFCSAAGVGQSFKSLLTNTDNLLTFANHGGIGGGGVCWWHSRFQRLATYLAVYRPDLPKPNAGSAKWIVDAISGGGTVVEIPGYRNLSEFSRDYAYLIQNRLESWQREDGILHFAWIKGMKGAVALQPDSMRRQMDFIYNEVVNLKRIVWTKLQVPGVAAHAWLVFDMKPTSNGYQISVIDSNYSSAETVTYTNGDSQLDTSAGRGVATVDNWKELFRAGAAIRSYCGMSEFPEYAR